ncbi:MAG: dihydrolipoyl dehydrogenase [Leptospiraceae bacterium]|nr:dihydrolipoyl dehydrogenase [Leptospiraceae bacterium]
MKTKKEALQEYVNKSLFQSLLLYFFIYVIIVAVGFPGATILTLAGGAGFGLVLGIILISFASTIGATLNFLLSRYFFRDFIKKKFPKQMEEINKGIEKDGAFYLFTLRMIPLFPFFLINLLMGLTNISVLTFFFVSQIGMLLGTIVYVNAGTKLANIDSVEKIFSFELILSFSLVGILPTVAKKIIDFIQSTRILRKYKKPKKFDYNLAVIGAGSAGLVSAYIAATIRAKVILAEKHKMGGDCLNYGCVPSKAILSSAKRVSQIQSENTFGIQVNVYRVNIQDVMRHVHSVIQQIEPHDSIERYTKLGVDCILGNAKILSPYEIEVDGKVITTKNIIIATGAEPIVPILEGMEYVQYLTSENIWELKELPKKLVVLGGGAVGCELAQAFKRLGAEVTLVEMTSRLLNREDEFISDFLFQKFRKEGIQVLTNTQAQKFLIEKNKKFIQCVKDNTVIHVEFDHVLLALGRKPRTTGFGLEELEIPLNSNGTIQVNEYLQTIYPNISACGDVVGPYQFTHVASHQAWYATVNALFRPFKKFKVNYKIIPYVIFTDPEIARLGINESEARARGIDYEVTTFPFNDLDRSITENELEGQVRVITQKGKDKILGVTIIGTSAGELLAEFTLAMKYKIGLGKILGTIHPYPTRSEVSKYVAGAWRKKHAPEKILKFLEKFHSWRR